MLMLKRNVAAIIFWFLGRGFQAVAALDPRIKEIIANWDDSVIFLLQVEPHGPSMVMQKQEGKLVYLGKFERSSKELEADFSVRFKCLEAALMLLTGRLGIAQAYAEHRFSMKGDIYAYGMPLVECLNTVEAYLFPSVVTKHLFQQMPQRARSKARIYLGTVFGV